MKVKKILVVYRNASGQEVNVYESGVMFNKNTCPADR